MDVTLNETIKVAKGVFLLSLLYVLVALVFGFLDKALLYGIFFGSVFTVLNFRLLSLSIKKSVTLDPSKAMVYAGRNYIVRLVLTGIVLLVSVKADYINVIGTIIPMFFPKFIILYQNTRKGGI